MKTEELQELGLNEDQIKGVMALKGKAVQAESDKVAALTAERDSLTEQITQRDKDIKKIQKEVGDNEALAAQLSDLQTKYDADTKSLNETLAATKLDSAVTQALANTNARDPKDLKAFLNSDDIKFNDDGELVGLNDQITNLQQTKAYLFDGGAKQEYKPAGGSASSRATSLEAAMKSKDFNLTKYLEEQQGE